MISCRHHPSSMTTLVKNPLIVEAYSKVISSWSLKNIVESCRGCGISATGNKTVLANRLALALADTPPTSPWTIVSLDLGMINFAKAIIQVQEKPTLLWWEKFSIGLQDEYHPRGHALQVQKLAQKLLSNKFVNDNTVFLIERQTFRGGGLRMIPGNIIKVNRVEAQLHCFMLDHLVIPMDPRLVASKFGLNSGNKKKAAVELVDSFCSGSANNYHHHHHHPPPPLVDIPLDIAQRYRENSKRDDMADCLLQALAYLDWRNNLQNIKDKLSSEIGNRV